LPVAVDRFFDRWAESWAIGANPAQGGCQDFCV